MTTNLGKLGISRFIQNKVTNHIDNTVGGIYDRYDYFAEKNERWMHGQSIYSALFK